MYSLSLGRIEETTDTGTDLPEVGPHLSVTFSFETEPLCLSSSGCSSVVPPSTIIRVDMLMEIAHEPYGTLELWSSLA